MRMLCVIRRPIRGSREGGERPGVAPRRGKKADQRGVPHVHAFEDLYKQWRRMNQSAGKNKLVKA